jgi:pyridoxamine 5'-phosphate oxidase
MDSVTPMPSADALAGATRRAPAAGGGAKPDAVPDPAGTGLWDLHRMRREYEAAGLTARDLAPTWLEQLEGWLAAAATAGLPEPNAMVLATATADGRPSARTVLLKELDPDGLVFYTNYDSRKATELAENPYASAVFPWHPIGRQVVVTGSVRRIGRERSAAYFATRPREAQLGAWASPQSRPVRSRDELDLALDRVRARFGETGPIAVPEHWGGFHIAPDTVEFWQGRRGRLHDRLRYRREPSGWTVERIAP